MAKNDLFNSRLKLLTTQHAKLLQRRNRIDPAWTNGVFFRYQYPVLTAAHTPLFWRYDLNNATNPFLMERLGINAVFNVGAMEYNGAIVLVARVEGADRKSFFAIAESKNGVDHFKFRDYPITLPDPPLPNAPETNVYDMRLTPHQDGWIYGLFCAERRDSAAPAGDQSTAIAACGIARTKDLLTWQRLPDLKSDSAQQRNVVLHPEFINEGGTAKYALYTRPQDSFIEAGQGGGIGWALTDSMEHAVIHQETIIDPKLYHTIKEVKNGAGATPLKTNDGWLHLAHGVRNTAAGLRYVVYAFLCDLHEPARVIARPGGYFLAPFETERIGDVSNVTFCNGAVAKANGDVFIYYGSSDTRTHVATTTIAQLLDYVHRTPEDPLRSGLCVQQRNTLIARNLELGIGPSGDRGTG